MASIKTISNKTGVSWFAVFMFALLLAFILYTASIGSLVKYKAFLFETGVGGSSDLTSGTAIPDGQGVSSNSGSTQTSTNNAGSDVKTGLELASTIAMFV